MSSLKVRRLLPSLLRRYHSCGEELVDQVCKSLVSSRRLPLLGKRLCMHRLRCIFLGRIRILYLSTSHQQALHEERLGQEKYRSLCKAHSLYIFVHRRPEVLLLAFLVFINHGTIFKQSANFITEL
jgi:hypothetical protein